MEKFYNGKTDMEPWIETFTGQKFWYTGEGPEGIEIEDIAHALSHSCRFTGHCKKFLSVAEHSVLVSDHFIDPKKALWALLHDASEAYLADMASPVKQLLPEYKALERKIMGRIAKRFDLPDLFWEDEEIKKADWAQLRSEAKWLLPSGGKDWYFPEGTERGSPPMGWQPTAAEKEFLHAFKELTGVYPEWV
jgi:hypothetical protein